MSPGVRRIAMTGEHDAASRGPLRSPALPSGNADATHR